VTKGDTAASVPNAAPAAMPDSLLDSVSDSVANTVPDVLLQPVGEAAVSPTELALVVRGMSKAFGPTQALWPIDLDIRAGEIHALLGENGSGKSTFIKSLSGFHKADAGDVHVGGQKLTLGSAGSAHSLGCRFVHQDLGLIASETVMDNLNYGSRYPTVFGTINSRAARRAAVAHLERVGMDIDPRQKVGSLSPAQQTAVAVARALRPDGAIEPRLLVLDEPTARLPQQEVAQLLEIVRSVSRAGVAVIYVSHRIEEVFEVAKTVTVLRDGRKVATKNVADLDQRGLVNLLVGGALDDVDFAHFSAPPSDAPTVLDVHGLTSVQLTEVALEVRAGEVVGIAGITGSGRETILSTIFGGTPRSTGSVSADGRRIEPGRPDLSIAAGIAYLPPDRKISGGLLALTARENLMLADLGKHWRFPRLSLKDERTESKTWFARLSVRPGDNVERQRREPAKDPLRQVAAHRPARAATRRTHSGRRYRDQGRTAQGDPGCRAGRRLHPHQLLRHRRTYRGLPPHPRDA
jgi:ribose transport system ATP-binding protein